MLRCGEGESHKRKVWRRKCLLLHSVAYLWTWLCDDQSYCTTLWPQDELPRSEWVCHLQRKAPFLGLHTALGKSLSTPKCEVGVKVLKPSARKEPCGCNKNDGDWSLAPGWHSKTLNTSIVCGGERLMPKDYISETWILEVDSQQRPNSDNVCTRAPSLCWDVSPLET